ncbi:GYF domain-containingprotein [Purpureocillium lavendulum]|uniref:GYF domain-containingprotein n=1 Tax=Purpureocillium lavendulum TaxID=1247861 RepID=A0AB34FVL3_9HYPO|nr:GYF domain-containingprotein [Purpureocillium lavendulum]
MATPAEPRLAQQQKENAVATQSLLARAHSPDSASRIYADKILHRTLHLRPSSPPPAVVNARAARRKARETAKAKSKIRPKPLSSRERRQLGLHDIPRDGHKYDIYEPLNALWRGYAREVLGNDIFTGGPTAAAKLASAELHGALAEVVRSRCPGRVGIQGIVVRDRKFVLEIITKKTGLKLVPKEGTTFRIHIPAVEGSGSAQDADSKPFAFDVLGDQLMLRSRRDGRSANGTLTFRRSSTTPIAGQASNPPPSSENAVQHPSIDEAPVAHPVMYEAGPARYSKDDLLDMFRAQKSPDDTSRLFIPGWDPSTINGGGGRAWGKSSDAHIPQEPNVCWDQTGETLPMGLQDLSLDEKEAFSAEINSPLKPPTQNKDAHQGNVNGRKASVSHGSGNAYGVNSPSSVTRPGTRRRETVDSNPFSAGGLASPTAGRFSREDSSSWLPRKAAELKESEPDDGDGEHGAGEGQNKLPFGNLMRSNTSGSAGMTAIWPTSSQTAPSGGAFGNFALPTSSAVGEKRAAGAAGGSRLAHLIPKDNQDSAAAKSGDSSAAQQTWRSRPRTDTDPFGDDELSGSAVLGGAQDTTATTQAASDRVGILGTPVKGSTSDFGMSGLNLGVGQSGDIGPVSPSETNPYRSPPAERHDHDENDPTGSGRGLGPDFNESHGNFGSIGRGFGAAAFDGGDRSQTSSAGPKNYPLGLSGWPAPVGPSSGTPDRERTNFGGAFGNSLFSPMGDLQSPGLSNLGSVFGPPSAGGIAAGSIGRGSKLGSLFPPAMQAQMQSQVEQEHGFSDADPRQTHPLGAIGRAPPRDTESPMRSSRGVFEELFPSSDANRSHGLFSSAETPQSAGAAAAPQSYTPVGGGLPFGGIGQAGSEPPAAQVRQMVMPDRMRWVYLDPQGQVQGPFTGLEMNDWYKANFFTPDLRVKKVEDPEFEPLGQLIRRIGNSREPFLVPQIGIPHGPASQTGPFAAAATPGGVVPPLSGVFPSFGRTLTAEEQNNLERRKQEEQYIMAQQREFMMRQQAMTKFQMPGPGLQHHSSAQSLQSQPSFGSISSPIGAPQQQQQPPQQQPAPIGSMPPGGFADQPAGGQAGGRPGQGNAESFRLDDMANLTDVERQVIASIHGAAGDETGQQQQQQRGMQPGGADFRSGLPEADQLSEDPEGFRERLKEFEDLRAQHEAEQAAQAKTSKGHAEGAESPAAPPGTASVPSGKGSKKKRHAEDATLSLTQQVQQAQAAAAASSGPSDPDMPMPFPVPSSTTPLPAPTAQRVRSNLPEQYSRSQSGTPDVTQPPPLAPWAREPGHEGQKGPSLKEIQEAEARKAAKAEEAAAALRKAAMEQEAAIVREKERQAHVAAAAGLPASSTWGHGSPVSATSPWVKPGAAKGPAVNTAAAVPSSASKKTLAEIQREEEVRKQKARDVAVQSGSPAITSKSYANLAGKPNQSPVPSAPSPGAVPTAGWATVGAGGKVKVPTGPAASGRSASVSSAKAPITVGKPVSKPVASGPINGRVDVGSAAMEEFSKWTRRELSRGLTDVTDISDFQADLDALPLDTGVIADAVYINSKTMDGRHFAEEYVRRKKLAQKGVVEKQPPSDSSKSPSSAGGWSEVAKRSNSTQPKESDSGNIQGAGFKVVPGRKKGKK